MKLDRLIVILAFLVSTVTVRLFFLLIDESGRGWSTRAFFMSFIEFGCYSIAFYFLGRLFSESKFHSIAYSLAIGSLAFYLCTIAFGLYQDWWYISSNSGEFYDRHVGMVFSTQLYIRFAYIIIFLIAFSFLWMMLRVFSKGDSDSHLEH